HMETEEEKRLREEEETFTELSRYIIHCMLHCKGYKDETVTEKKLIRAEEDKAIKHALEKKVLLTNPNPLYT
nr:hypothetical protein [bacterium]